MRNVVLAFIVTIATTALSATDESASQTCTRCHRSPARLAATTGGHAAGIACVTCHELRRPDVFGPGHRSVPTDCTSHHTANPQVHPIPTQPVSAARVQRRCLKCHDPHGSPNTHLIRPALRIRGRLRPVAVPVVPDDVAAEFVDPSHPGRGLCEVCHRTTRFYRADGRGEGHFAGDCTTCHEHEAGFQPVATDTTCAVCHPAEADRLAGPGLHHDRFAGACSSCHAEVDPTPGPGHRATAACRECHDPRLEATHAPGVPIPCVGCHEPHGTGNRRLIRDVLRTIPGDEDHAVQFDSFAGQADGSFASLSDPGTGLCETCHTRTRFYRDDASGAAHYTTTCTRCHPHASGFLPQ